MELTERETLVRVEQQLKDSVTNQSQIMADLKEIFQRIEKESKVVHILRGDFDTHKGTSNVKLDTVIKELKDAEKKLEDLDDDIKKQETKFDKALADQKLHFTDKINKERIARSNFQKTVQTSVRTAAWIFGSLASLATLLSGVQILIKFLPK